jgi:hypothetical protein
MRGLLVEAFMAKGFVLDSTSKSLQAAAATGNAAVDYVATWSDSTATSFTEGSSDGQITSTTAADITPAPASNVRRVIKGLTLYNRAASSEAITLSYRNGASSRFITRIVLTAGQAWSLDDLTTIAATTTPVTLVSTYRNLLINGNFAVAQRAKNYASVLPSFTTTATTLMPFTTAHTGYVFDRWFLLRQTATGTLNVTQASTFFGTATGGINDLSSGTGVKLTPATVSKFGICQMVENRNCAHLLGQSVTLSFQAKAVNTTSGVGNLTAINFAILSYNGATADAINRSTIINTTIWNATGVNPTLGAGYSYIRDGSSALSTDWQTFTISTQLPSSFKNIGVMIWSNSITNATGVNLLITDVQLEPGLTATSFETIPQNITEDLCGRYFVIYHATRLGMPYPGSGTWNGTIFDHTFSLSVPMRIPPTFLGTNQNTFKTAFFKNYTFGTGPIVPQPIRANSVILRTTRGALSPLTSSAPNGSDTLADFGAASAGNSLISFNSEL